MMSLESLAWLALNLIPGVGPARAHRWAEALGTPEGIWAASVERLQALPNISPALVKEISGFAWKEKAEEEIGRARLVRCRIFTLADEAYPAWLRCLPFPPPVLYVRGELWPQDEKALGVVGCRQPTPYGKEAARFFTQGLCEAGYTIVSGLARGIDAEAHRTALETGGRTLAVLAHGLDRVYPEEHRSLHDEIVLQGAVVSEFPLGVPPLRENFPRRNRIISGLAQGVLVVEAGLGSGALITARWAVEQGREVFAVPGLFHSRWSQGAHALIQEGAKLAMSVQDLLDELPAGSRAARISKAPVETGSGQEQDSELARQIYQALQVGARHVDQLASECRQTVPALLNELLQLELQGRVEAVPGGLYYWVRN